ncbi:MAG: LamG domain-containing protein, partial [Sedimentisphaerales bacterium]|nr:LamG domain-containing protein [Sedimentisphaerales bacterium]
MYKKAGFLVVVMFVLSGTMASMAQDPDPALVGWWKLDEGQGTVANDSSGNGVQGTITNLNGGLGSSASVWDVDPERGVVASFNGDDTNGAYISAGTIPAMDFENEFTWAFWAKQQGDGTGVNQTMLGNRYGGTESPLQFVKFTPTKFEYYNDDGDYLNSIDYVDIPAGQWIHHVGVKKGATLTYYRNGVEAGTTTLTKTMDQNPFYMGGDPVSERWSGWLSDVRLYERALTADEVKQLAFRPKARLPEPAHEATGVVMALLQWTAGDSAMFHDVYFGTTPELTEADRVATRQMFALYFHPFGLEPGATYYWRVDEIEADGVTVHAGEVWRFTAMPVTSWAPEPGDDAEKVLLTPELTWSAGLGALGHHLYFGTDPEAVAAGAAETDMGPTDGTSYQITAPLEVGIVYYWRVDGTDVAGSVTQTGEVWSFTTIDAGPGGAIREWWLGNSGSDIPSLTDDPRFPDEPDGREVLAAMDGPVDWRDN